MPAAIWELHGEARIGPQRPASWDRPGISAVHEAFLNAGAWASSSAMDSSRIRARADRRDLLQLRYFLLDERQLRLSVHREPRLQHRPRAGSCFCRAVSHAVLDGSQSLLPKAQVVCAACISLAPDYCGRVRQAPGLNCCWWPRARCIASTAAKSRRRSLWRFIHCGH